MLAIAGAIREVRERNEKVSRTGVIYGVPL